MPFLDPMAVSSGVAVEVERSSPGKENTKSGTMGGDTQSLTSFPSIERKQGEDGVTFVETVVDKVADKMARTEVKSDDIMEGVEYTSRPPSPPSGARTPTLRIEECPPRLRSYIPPPNYGAIQEGAIYRSAFPQDRNLEFLEGLEIRTILCLVKTDPSEKYARWTEDSGINRMRVDIAPNKEGKVSTTWDSLCEALLIVMDCANYPLFVHCNQGRHRTGCVIACLRKVQRWPIEDVLAEYRAYANPKIRDGDIDLIKAFDPECVFDFAKSHGYLDNMPFMKRMDSAIANVDALAEALSSREDESMEYVSGLSSNASVFSEDMLEMRPPAIDPELQRARREFQPSAESVVEELVNTASHTENVQHSVNDEVTESEREDATATVTELTDDAMTPPPNGNSEPFFGNF